MSKREEWINNKRKNYENNLSDIVTGVVKPLFDKRSRIEANIIINWGRIFDAGLRSKINFQKLIFTDKKNNKFILYITLKNKDFLEITHSAEIIKEQINIFLGFNGIEKVVISKI